MSTATVCPGHLARGGLTQSVAAGRAEAARQAEAERVKAEAAARERERGREAAAAQARAEQEEAAAAAAAAQQPSAEEGEPGTPPPGGVLVKVSEGGAGFVCNNDLRVTKITASGASAAAGVQVGMQLLSFQAADRFHEIDAAMNWASFKDLCRNSEHPWAFSFGPAAAAAAKPKKPSAEILVKVSEGGAGFVCNNDLRVTKITASGASAAAGVQVGMYLLLFEGSNSSCEIKPGMSWASFKDVCRTTPHPWVRGRSLPLSVGSVPR